MRLQRMLGHLPGLFHPDPKSVLIVGFGAGVTAGSFQRYPGIERIVICEIEPLVPATAGEYFAAESYDVRDDPRTEIIYDDARHFIATTDETFDIITSDPIHPWVKGSAALYSLEYFELVKSRLNPGGFVTQWIPLYQSSEEVVKTEIATFVEAFPEATLWNSDASGQGYDLVILGQREPLRVDALDVLERLERQPTIESSLSGVGFGSLIDVFSTYVSSAADLRPWLQDAEINRDRSLRLQYMAGLTVDRYEAPAVFQALSRFRGHPREIIVIPAGQENSLQGTLEEAVPNPR
jgi:spermidine synthase